MTQALVIDYYSDVLCVWAWIAQRRIEELHKNFGSSIQFNYYYVDIFGDVATKMANQWASKGGYEGFAVHVKKSCDDYDAVTINPKTWVEVKPTTSANAHLLLKAVELNFAGNAAIDMALTIRKGFFESGVDISNLDCLYQLIESSGLDVALLKASVNNGEAIAALMSDYQQAKQNAIKGSPSYVMDGGRQTLYGNVGYRVLSANTEELLKRPEKEASWC
ncbi:MAG: putative DsbA family dithiol-disulfide isomerase [Porticoccus sp.]|jgi:predicted DsbA family dithiol-disulfide isomerase